MTDATRAQLLDPDRLAAVHGSELIGGKQEDGFDRLTELAALLVEAPLAFMTVVDAERSLVQELRRPARRSRAVRPG